MIGIGSCRPNPKPNPKPQTLNSWGGHRLCPLNPDGAGLTVRMRTLPRPGTLLGFWGPGSPLRATFGTMAQQLSIQGVLQGVSWAGPGLLCKQIQGPGGLRGEGGQRLVFWQVYCLALCKPNRLGTFRHRGRGAKAPTIDRWAA